MERVFVSMDGFLWVTKIVGGVIWLTAAVGVLGMALVVMLALALKGAILGLLAALRAMATRMASASRRRWGPSP